MSTALTVIEAHERIAKAARSANHETRIVEAIAIGEHVRQGDLYITRIDKVGANWKPTHDRQLAPGVSTGSRHVAAGKVEIRTSPDSNPVDRSGPIVRLLGPQISARERFVIEHPEHAHMDLPPGDYQTTYQMDFARQRAVRD